MVEDSQKQACRVESPRDVSKYKRSLFSEQCRGYLKHNKKVTDGKTWTNTNRTNKHKDSGSLYGGYAEKSKKSGVFMYNVECMLLSHRRKCFLVYNVNVKLKAVDTIGNYSK